MKSKTKGNLVAIGGLALLVAGFIVSLFGNIAPKSSTMMGLGIILVAIASIMLFIADRIFNRRGATPISPKKHRALLT